MYDHLEVEKKWQKYWRKRFVVLHDHSRCVDIQGRLIHVEGHQPHLLFERV